MKCMIRFTIGAFAFSAAVVTAQPSLATDTRTAIKLCDNNPSCDYRVSDTSVLLWVKDGKGGSTYVDCPSPGKSGECVAVRKQGLQRQQLQDPGTASRTLLSRD